MSKEDKIKTLLEKREKAKEGGGLMRLESQRKKGKLTARERIDLLLDEGSFEEYDMFVTHRCNDFGLSDEIYLGDGVITGHGTIDGRVVFLFSQDFSVLGGSLSETFAKKICKVMGQAMKVGAPIIGFNDSGGATIHATKSGVAHFRADDEQEGIHLIRKMLEYLPLNNLEDPIQTECKDSIERVDDILNEIVPDNPNQPYDVKDIIYSIVDNKEFLEMHRHYAKNIVVGFAKFNGMPVGIVANQPNFLAVVLDIEASRKAARFVRFCDCFNVPIVTLVDVPGFLPGSGQEYGGIITHGAKLMFAYGEATVPKITITLRKSYGGVLFAKVMNLFLKEENKINPLIGSAGVSAVPDSARVSQMEGLRADPTNHLLMHAMTPNVAGVIGSAVVAGILLSYLM
ncbi:MAG: hypothetical protein FJY10_00715 [Bacteroidetes bacterium]|nr:hypothetical protein [Bacteroidota bacterium]